MEEYFYFYLLTQHFRLSSFSHPFNLTTEDME